jgi:hypothetical protein
MEKEKINKCIKCGSDNIIIAPGIRGNAHCVCGNNVILDHPSSFIDPNEVIRKWNEQNPSSEKRIKDLLELNKKMFIMIGINQLKIENLKEHGYENGDKLNGKNRES